MKGKIFNAQEVQAILAGNKTMFREVIKVQPISSFKSEGEIIYDSSINAFMQFGSDEKYRNYCYHFGKTPYQVGQKIFVKETYKNIYIRGIRGAWFKASTSEKTAKSEKWLPPMALPQHLSRLTLQIKEIRVERLGSISEEDAIAEGVERGIANGEQCGYKDYLVKNLILADAKDSFKTLWNATHKKPEEKFEASPFCWVVDFEVVK